MSQPFVSNCRVVKDLKVKNSRAAEHAVARNIRGEHHHGLRGFVCRQAFMMSVSLSFRSVVCIAFSAPCRTVSLAVRLFKASVGSVTNLSPFLLSNLSEYLAESCLAEEKLRRLPCSSCRDAEASRSSVSDTSVSSTLVGFFRIEPSTAHPAVEGWLDTAVPHADN